MRLAGHWRERFQAKFGNEGGMMETTWSKRGVPRSNIADKKAKGPPHDASYAGRVGVHYLHPRGGLKGENLKKKQKSWNMLENAKWNVAFSAESQLKARKWRV